MSNTKGHIGTSLPSCSLHDKYRSKTMLFVIYLIYLNDAIICYLIVITKIENKQKRTKVGRQKF